MYCDNARLLDSCRDAACLAHAVPGVALRLTVADREPGVLVSASCLAARIDPCQFRGLVVSAMAGRAAVLEQFDAVDVVGGVVHLGGGLYQSSHPGGADERWFVTSLDHERVAALMQQCPDDRDDSFSVLVKPDPALGRSAVRVRCHDRSLTGRLDEVAMWAMSACLVEELVVASRTTPSGRPEPSSIRRRPDGGT